MVNEGTTASQIEEQRLQYIQMIWAARNNNNNADPTANSTSQEQYDASIGSKVSPEDFMEMVRRREQEYSNVKKPKLCTCTATTLTLDDMAYLASQEYQDALRLDAEREAKEIKEKQNQEKLARMILERGEPPVLYRKDKGKLSDYMMDSPEDIPTLQQLENIANEIANLDLNEHEELELSKVLHLASKRYNLNLQSAQKLVEVFCSHRIPEVGFKKVYEHNTGRVVDYVFFKRHVYSG